MSWLELLAATPAFASAAVEAEHHAPPISDVIFPTLNFLIYAFILVKFALPPIRNFLRSRREEVLHTVTQASAKKQQAEALVREYRTKLAGLEQEAQSLLSSLRAEAEREKNKLLEDGRALAAKIKEDALFLANQEIVMARQKIRGEMADRAEVRARELVLSNLSAADQARLAGEFLNDIGQTR